MNIHAIKPAEAARVIGTRSLDGIREALQAVPAEIRADVRRMVWMQVSMFRDSNFRMGWCPAAVQPTDFWPDWHPPAAIGGDE